jgi:hypothetical protein
MRPGLSEVLGAPGRTGSAHVVQFRSIGIEHFGEELAPECLELGKRGGFASAASDRSGERGGRDGGHDAFSLFSRAAFAALERFFGAENEFWLDLLKDGFNCRDLAA